MQAGKDIVASAILGGVRATTRREGVETLELCLACSTTYGSPTEAIEIDGTIEVPTLEKLCQLSLSSFYNAAFISAT